MESSNQPATPVLNLAGKSEGKSGQKFRNLPSKVPRISPDHPQPTSYASSQVIDTYLNAMHRKAAYLARRGERGRVYISASPLIAADVDRWGKTLARLKRDIRPARVQSMTDVWQGLNPGAQYAEGWSNYADTITGLVVVTGPLGIVGRGTVREIEAAQQRGLPILVHAFGPLRQVPLVDCRTEPIDGRNPTRQLKIDIPAGDFRRTATMIACLAAMGAVRREP